MCVGNTSTRRVAHCAVCYGERGNGLVEPDESVIERLRSEGYIAQDCPSRKICTAHYRTNELKVCKDFSRLKNRDEMPTLNLRRNQPDAESTQMDGVNGQNGLNNLNEFSPIYQAKRRYPFDNENNKKAENEENLRKKSKISQTFVEELESRLMHEGFQNLRKADGTVSFSVKGQDGVTIFVQINEVKLKLRTIFLYYRELVQIERNVSSGSDSLMSMLLNFLALAKNITKKEELPTNPNWNDFIIRQDAPKPVPPPTASTSAGCSSYIKTQDQSTQSDVGLQMANDEAYLFLPSAHSALNNQSGGSQNASVNELSRPSDVLLNRSCVKCDLPAELTCNRCKDYYCSKECQEIDWPTHKQNCFPMPGLGPAK